MKIAASALSNPMIKGGPTAACLMTGRSRGRGGKKNAQGHSCLLFPHRFLLPFVSDLFDGFCPVCMIGIADELNAIVHVWPAPRWLHAGWSEVHRVAAAVRLDPANFEVIDDPALFGVPRMPSHCTQSSYGLSGLTTAQPSSLIPVIVTGRLVGP